MTDITLPQKHGTSIEWTQIPGTTGETWNPIVAYDLDTGKRGWHCEKVSAGCANCYAETMNKAARFHGTRQPYTPAGTKRVRIELDEKTLEKPPHWRKPRTVFVCSMTDLYGEWVEDESLDRIKAVQALTPQHTYIELTKRPYLAARYGHGFYARADDGGIWHPRRFWKSVTGLRCPFRKDGLWLHDHELIAYHGDAVKAGLPNVWLLTSVEDQASADERIPHLLQCPTAVRGLSMEPLIGPVDLSAWLFDGWDRCMPPNPYLRGMIHWLILGGESGPGARPCNVEWMRDIIKQADAAGVPVFVKQLGARAYQGTDNGGYSLGLKHPKGGDLSEWPEDLRRRAWPEGATK